MPKTTTPALVPSTQRRGRPQDGRLRLTCLRARSGVAGRRTAGPRLTCLGFNPQNTQMATDLAIFSGSAGDAAPVVSSASYNFQARELRISIHQVRHQLDARLVQDYGSRQ